MQEAPPPATTELLRRACHRLSAATPELTEGAALLPVPELTRLQIVTDELSALGTQRPTARAREQTEGSSQRARARSRPACASQPPADIHIHAPRHPPARACKPAIAHVHPCFATLPAALCRSSVGAAAQLSSEEVTVSTPLPPPPPSARLVGSFVHPLHERLLPEAGPSEDDLLGDAREPPIVIPIEVSSVPASVSDPMEACLCLQRLVEACLLLDSQRLQMAGTYTLRATLIAHVFLSVLPIPAPLTAAAASSSSSKAGGGGGDSTPTQAGVGAATDASGAPNAPDISDDAGGDGRRASSRPPLAQPRCLYSAEGAIPSAAVQASLLRWLGLAAHHYATVCLSLPSSPELDATRILVCGAMAAIADAVTRVVAPDAPSLLSLHYSGKADGPSAGFALEMRTMELECERALLPSPQQAAVRTRLLDYFRSAAAHTPPSHFIFRFDRSMELGPAERALLGQMCVQLALPRDDASLRAYLTGEDPTLLEMCPGVSG